MDAETKVRFLQMCDSLEELKNDTRIIKNTIHGDPDSDELGMKHQVRQNTATLTELKPIVSSLDQSDKTRKKVLGLLGGGTGLVILERIAAIKGWLNISPPQ